MAITDEIVKANDTLQSRRKLSMILNSKSISEPNHKIGDLVEIFQHRKNNKRGPWSSARKIIQIDDNNRTITVPGRNGKTVCAAFEDVRMPINNGDFSAEICEEIDQLNKVIEDCHTSSNMVVDYESSASENYNRSDSSRKFQTNDEIDFTIREEDTEPMLIEIISVYWPLENKFYTGTVSSIEDGTTTILFYGRYSTCIKSVL